MILISHRGNINGKFELYENNPNYIDKAISDGYDVEVDVRLNDGILYLGHDAIQYDVSPRWFRDRLDKLWIHCKNIESIEWFSLSEYKYNYFWHDNDTITFTSRGYMWAHSGKQPIFGSIAVLPELFDQDTSKCKGICSDFIKKHN